MSSASVLRFAPPAATTRLSLFSMTAGWSFAWPSFSAMLAARQRDLIYSSASSFAQSRRISPRSRPAPSVANLLSSLLFDQTPISPVAEPAASRKPEPRRSSAARLRPAQRRLTTRCSRMMPLPSPTSWPGAPSPCRCTASSCSPSTLSL